MKIYCLMIMSLLFSSCSLDDSSIISDKDGDGMSDGFFGEVYEDRQDSIFYFLIADLKAQSSSRSTWYKGSDPIQLERTGSYPDWQRVLIKDGVTYQFTRSSANKKYAIYQKMTTAEPPVGTGKYVVMAIEAIPIFDEAPAVLLISKDPVFDDEAAAKTYGDTHVIPELSITIPFLDLVFDPDTLIIEKHNMVEHLKAITDGYTLLEIFGSETYINKKELLKPYGYDVLLD